MLILYIILGVAAVSGGGYATYKIVNKKSENTGDSGENNGKNKNDEAKKINFTIGEITDR